MLGNPPRMVNSNLWRAPIWLGVVFRRSLDNRALVKDSDFETGQRGFPPELSSRLQDPFFC
jgi:hypothetical protein